MVHEMTDITLGETYTDQVHGIIGVAMQLSQRYQREALVELETLGTDGKIISYWFPVAQVLETYPIEPAVGYSFTKVVPAAPKVEDSYKRASEVEIGDVISFPIDEGSYIASVSRIEIDGECLRFENHNGHSTIVNGLNTLVHVINEEWETDD